MELRKIPRVVIIILVIIALVGTLWVCSGYQPDPNQDLGFR
jgi:hypothetical protein